MSRVGDLLIIARGRNKRHCYDIEKMLFQHDDIHTDAIFVQRKLDIHVYIIKEVLKAKQS